MQKQHPGRLTEIDLAKGLAIALVVWGHVVAGEPPRDAEWYMPTKNFVYLFHMPFFMFLSGVVAGYGYRPMDSLAGWGVFLKDKLLRLLPAYLLVSVLIVIGKVVAARYVYVDNVPSSVGGGLWEVLVQPNHSAAKSFWFIYVLFLFYLSLHPLLWLFRQKVPALIALGVLLLFVRAPETLMLDVYCRFLLFFALGFYTSARYQAFLAMSMRWGAAWLALFLAVAVYGVWAPFPHAREVVGLLSLPSLFYLIGLLRQPSWQQLLLVLGKYSFAIYLFNTIFIGLSKAVGLKLLPWDGANFYLFAAVLFVAGLWLPIVLKRQVLRHVPPLDRITR